MGAARLGPAMERWAHQLLAKGRDPVDVAVKLQVPYQVVRRLVDEQDTQAEVPASVSTSLEQDAGAGDRPMRAARPKPSRAKPEEAVAVEVPAAADDAGSRASGGAGAAAPIQSSPDGCQLGEGDADGRNDDPSEPSDHRGGHRGRTSTPPEVGPGSKPGTSPRANGGADPRSVTAGRGRHPTSIVLSFPAPTHGVAPAVDVFAGTRLETAFGPGAGVGLGDVGAGQCRWPLWPNGARPSFRCCGAATADGARYCEAHARQSRGSAVGSIDGLGKWAARA